MENEGHFNHPPPVNGNFSLKGIFNYLCPPLDTIVEYDDYLYYPLAKKQLEKLKTFDRLLLEIWDHWYEGLDQKTLKTMFAKTGLRPLPVKKFNALDTNKNGEIEGVELSALIDLLIQSKKKGQS